MSMKSLEAAILAELRTVTGIKGLRQKDIQEWSTGPVQPEDKSEEIVVALPSMGVNVAYLKPAKRAKS